MLTYETHAPCKRTMNIYNGVDRIKEENITSDDEGIVSIWEYLERAKSSYKKKRKFDDGDVVKLRPPNLFNQSAKRRRKWYGPFVIKRKCKGKKWLIWDDELGETKVKESELEHMVGEDLEDDDVSP
ncbi:hypothetical protein P8452_20489 [Trifolium repens]|nr:hypothetical protein P8452_20489 [Trifolium repens]